MSWWSFWRVTPGDGDLPHRQQRPCQPFSPNKIEFPDYTAVELLQITQVLAKNKGYTLAEACTEPLLGYYARWQAADARTAGNGRLARNTLEKAIFHQSRCLVAEPAAALI